MGVVAHAGAVLDDAAFAWMFENPGQAIGTASGRPLAVAMPVEQLADGHQLIQAGSSALPSGGRRFVRKLRRRVNMYAASTDETAAHSIQRSLYGNAYKGVTDLVTKFVWPEPAYHVTRLCAQLRIRPNMVTVTGMLLMLLAAWLFWQAEFGAGLAAAWAMTFLDTVDGKLARVTIRSSKLGDVLDHGTDILHPPLWWWAVTIGAIALDPGRELLLWQSCAAILIVYVLSRFLEEGFKKRFGFNAFIWRPFDSRFRLVVARRNILLLLLTAGALTGMLSESWVAAAAWSILSLAIQIARLILAGVADQRETLRPWLE